MQEKLLNAYLGNIIDQQVFESKSSALRTELTDLDQSIETVQKFDPARGEGVVQIFDFSQKAANLWESSNITLKRDLLETLSLNRAVSDVSLCITKRKPFDMLAEQPKFEKSRGVKI